MSDLELTIKGEVESLHLEPGDRIIISIETQLPRDHLEQLKDQTRTIFPGHEIVLLAPGLRLSKQTG